MASPGDQMTALAERIVPIMQDFGLSGFVLVGYLEDAESRRRRVCIANTANDPAMEDGLRPVIHFAHLWGAVAPAAREPEVRGQGSEDRSGGAPAPESR